MYWILNIIDYNLTYLFPGIAGPSTILFTFPYCQWAFSILRLAFLLSVFPYYHSNLSVDVSSFFLLPVHLFLVILTADIHSTCSNHLTGNFKRRILHPVTQRILPVAILTEGNHQLIKVLYCNALSSGCSR